jgi:hypothetical protein
VLLLKIWWAWHITSIWSSSHHIQIIIKKLLSYSSSTSWTIASSRLKSYINFINSFQHLLRLRRRNSLLSLSIQLLMRSLIQVMTIIHFLVNIILIDLLLFKIFHHLLLINQCFYPILFWYPSFYQILLLLQLLIIVIILFMISSILMWFLTEYLHLMKWIKHLLLLLLLQLCLC